VIRPQVLREDGYKYIHPVLICNLNNNLPVTEDQQLNKAIRAYIDTIPGNDVSVYYLPFLPGGKWAGVNEDESFSPASMLKVPTMLAILKYADSHSDFLSKEIYYDGSFDDNKAEYFKPQKAIRPGNYYSIDQLLTYMIGYSDNNAARLLNGSIDAHSLEAIYINLGIQLPSDATTHIDFMSPRTYALFLRMLYGSTYLSREMSEKALALMTTVDFPGGLLAGVPPTVTVADKFGERQVFTPRGVLSFRELHDCGIVYSPDHPYLLCIMTRGSDFDTLTTAIRSISKIVYDYVAQSSAK
jgi:beta-lactamase class A